MTRPQGDERRRTTRGRRESDGKLEAQIGELRRGFERLERTVLPVAGQVADVDGSLQALRATLEALERWLEDERAARRHHDAELDAALERQRERYENEVGRLRELIAGRFAECMGAIGTLGMESKAGRRTIIVAILTTAGVILAAYLGK